MKKSEKALVTDVYAQVAGGGGEPGKYYIEELKRAEEERAYWRNGSLAVAALQVPIAFAVSHIVSSGPPEGFWAMQGAFVVGWLLNALRNEHARGQIKKALSLAPDEESPPSGEPT
jgi:hypothetical protein